MPRLIAEVPERSQLAEDSDCRNEAGGLQHLFAKLRASAVDHGP